MLVHSVYFWLKEGLSEEDKKNFYAGVESLKDISCVEACFVGTPAATEARPIIDHSYDVALTVVLQDVAAHDQYQVDPIHLKFVETFKCMFAKLVIYDAD